jgi:hypothetical protein
MAGRDSCGCGGRGGEGGGWWREGGSGLRNGRMVRIQRYERQVDGGGDKGDDGEWKGLSSESMAGAGNPSLNRGRRLGGRGATLIL